MDKVEKKGDELLKNMGKIMGSRIDEMTNSTNMVMLDLMKIIESMKKENPDLKIEVNPKILIPKPIEEEIKEIEKLPDDDKKKLARSLKGMKDAVSMKKLKAISDMFKNKENGIVEDNKKLMSMEYEELIKIYNDITVCFSSVF